MNEFWQALDRQLILGTGQRTTELPVPDPLAPLLEATEQNRAASEFLAEEKVLDALTVGVTYRRVGAARAPREPGVSTRAARELRPETTPEQQQLLNRIPPGKRSRGLLRYWLEHTKRAGLVLSAPLLVPFLDLATKEASLRHPVRGVLGTRGAWLAEQGLAWKWAVGAEPKDSTDDLPWQVGTTEARERWLAQRRLSDPHEARRLLQETWSSERARDRTRLLAALENALVPEDEAFLEECLDDRSKGVRSAASSLLSQLEGSALIERMTARAQSYLEFSQEGLRRELALTVELPATLEPDFVRDGISEKAPSGIGQRAWWLQQILACVPPRVWVESSGATVPSLIQAAESSDFADAILNGWATASLRHRAADWCEHWIMTPRAHATMWTLLAEPEQVECGMKIANSNDPAILHSFLTTAEEFPTPWPTALALVLVDAARRVPRKTRARPEDLLPLAEGLPLDLDRKLERSLKDLHRDFDEEYAQLMNAMETRREMKTVFSESAREHVERKASRRS